MILWTCNTFLWKEQSSLRNLLLELITFFVDLDLLSKYKNFVSDEKDYGTKFLLLSLFSQIILDLIIVPKAVLRTERDYWTSPSLELFVHNVVFDHVTTWQCFFEEMKASWSEHNSGLVNSALMGSVLVSLTKCRSLEWAKHVIRTLISIIRFL